MKSCVLAFLLLSFFFTAGYAQSPEQNQTNSSTTQYAASPNQANQGQASRNQTGQPGNRQASHDQASTLLGGDSTSFNDNSIFGYPNITSQAVVLVILALSPFLIMLLTSFVKIVITLSLLRNAIGVQQTPPNQVVNGIALIITIYVMFPTGMAMYNNVKPFLNDKMPKELFSGDTASLVINMIDAAKEPLRDFLIRNTSTKNLEGFYKLTQKTFPEEVKGSITQHDFIVVVPSFVLSQIRAAFEIGVLIYLPFFVIDLVTSNILLAMQMMMLSPLSISLPLKLLLIVMIDGWTILVQGLVLSFN